MGYTAPALPADLAALRLHVAAPEIRDDLASVILISCAEEPYETSEFVESRCQSAVGHPSMIAENVGDLSTIGDEDLHDVSECSELERQGVCRFTRCESTSRNHSSIEADCTLVRKRQRTDASSSTDPPSSADQAKNQDSDAVWWGIAQRRCEKAGNSTQFRQFVACRANASVWKMALQHTSFQSAVHLIDVMLKNVSKSSTFLPVDARGNVHKFIAFKMLLVCIWEGQLRETDWSTLKVGDILR